MGREIEIVGEDVIVKDGNTVEAVRIDEDNPRYQELKAETNNFTENMKKPDLLESVEQTQTDLIFELMMKGVL